MNELFEIEIKELFAREKKFKFKRFNAWEFEMEILFEEFPEKTIEFC